jgi:RNA polymerase sigma factor for flagellar operon FliA
MRDALAQLPPRERRILSLYYFQEATMRQIGDAIGVNESRVSQLHARAIDRLRKILAAGEASSLATRQSKPVGVARQQHAKPIVRQRKAAEPVRLTAA